MLYTETSSFDETEVILRRINLISPFSCLKAKMKHNLFLMICKTSKIQVIKKNISISYTTILTLQTGLKIKKTLHWQT